MDTRPIAVDRDFFLNLSPERSVVSFSSTASCCTAQSLVFIKEVIGLGRLGSYCSTFKPVGGAGGNKTVDALNKILFEKCSCFFFFYSFPRRFRFTPVESHCSTA